MQPYVSSTLEYVEFYAPGDENGGVVVRVVAVVQDVLALLPDAEVLQSGLGVEGNDRTLLREAGRKTEDGV